MNKLGNKMNDLEKQVGQLEKELQDKNRVLKKMADELEKVLSQKNEDPLKENDYQSCFEENVKLESAKTALEGEIFKLDQKILDFQNHNQMLKGDISKLEDKNHLKEKENEEMKSKLFKIEEKQIKELDDFRKQIDNYKKQNMVP